VLHDGLDRKYNVHLPTGYDQDTAHPLVLSIHGYGGSAEGNEDYTTEMSPHADDNGYIAVYPEAYPFDDGSGGSVTTWSDPGCNSSPGPAGPVCAPNAFNYPAHPCAPGECNYCGCEDDVGFINTMLDQLEADYCIDAGRVYATGFSAGGGFVHRLGCELPNRFAAVAPVHGFLHIGFGCAPSGDTATMIVWGSQDRIMPEDGALSSDGYWYTAVDDVMEDWAVALGCDAIATSYPTVSDGTRNWGCTERDNCTSGTEVVSCSWRAGHWWPKNRKGKFGLEAIWEFFSKHSK
jgi:polyhydroxybutyrate depolymerase